MMVTRTDFDAARGDRLGDPDVDSLELIQEGRRTRAADLGEASDDGAYEPAGEDAIDDDMTGPVVPVGANEFRCRGCFLIFHRARIANVHDGHILCQDCV